MSTESYYGNFPLDLADVAEWIAEGKDSFEATIKADLHDLIESNGIDDANEYVDQILGVSLVDLQIEVDHAATGDLDGNPYTLALKVYGKFDPDNLGLEVLESGVTVEFHPQAWQDDYAVPVDPEGETRWVVAQRTAEEIEAVKGDLDLDFARFDPFAPKWVRDWSGPFEITVVE